VLLVQWQVYMDHQKTPLESDNVLNTSRNSYSTSPSAHPSSFSTLHTQVSPFSLKIQRDSDIPYRSGWVRKFKQSTESHSYLPPRDSSALFSSLSEKKSLQNAINSTTTRSKQNHATLSSYDNGNKNVPRNNDVNQLYSSPEMELKKDTEINSITDSIPVECIGAARSPWAKDILEEEGIDDTDDENDNHESNSILSLSEMNDLMSTPNSSGYVSSLTNRSSKSFDSVQMTEQLDTVSSQSPTLQHLEYLAAHSTTALVSKLLPKSNYTENRMRNQHISNTSEDLSEISLLQLKYMYGCQSRREAMKLALDQSDALSKASNDLIDLLFEYLNKCCGVETRQLFQHICQDESEGTPESAFLQKGLSLPASAIGWLSAYLYPTEADKKYQQQWLDVPSDSETSCLPNASPGPRMQSKLSLLRTLLSKNVTHLRITNVAWPGNIKHTARRKSNTTNNTPRRRGRMLLNFDSKTTSSFLAFFRHLQNSPRLDMRLFANVQYLYLDGIPGEWLSNLNQTHSCLQRLIVKRGHMKSVSNFLGLSEVNQPDLRHFDDIVDAEKRYYTPRKVAPSVKYETSAVLPIASSDTVKLDYMHKVSQPIIFTKLTHLSLSFCGIGESSDLGRRTRNKRFWSPLSLLPFLQTLDLSHNEFCDPASALQGLDQLPLLSGINLSFNRIETMNGVHMLLGNIKVLLLSHNLITNVDGLDRLFSLQKLDLSYNKISKLADIASLGRLPDLMHLSFMGNPLYSMGKRQFRCKVFNIFKDARMKDDSQLTYRSLISILPYLDGAQISNKELVKLKYLTFTQMLDVESDFNEEGAIKIKHVSNPKDKNIAVIYDSSQDFTQESSSDKRIGKVGTVRLERDLTRALPYRSPLSAISEYNVSIEEVVKYVHPEVENTCLQIDSFETDADMDEINASGSIYSSSDDDQSHSEQEGEENNNNLFDSQSDTEVDESSGKSEKHESVIRESCFEGNDENEPDVIKDDTRFTAMDNSISTEEELTNHFERYDFATLERAAQYDGPESYSDFIVANYYELYFRSYVFLSQQHNESIDMCEANIREKMLPRIQLYQSDRDLMILSIKHAQCQREFPSNITAEMDELLVSISKEEVLACGMAATGRIAPKDVEVHGFRGNTLLETSGKPYTFSISRRLMFCVSNMALYIIPDFSDSDVVERGSFPSSILTTAKFKDAAWPHAYCRHPLKFLRKISFDGYGFQRLTLHFRLPALHGEVLVQPDNGIMSNFDYCYVVFTRKQRRTIELMQSIQQAAKEAMPSESVDMLSEPSSIIVVNDDDLMLKAISRALSRPKFCDDILHYQILHQLWPDKPSLRARRSLVLTNDEIFLFHETYEGDCSACAPETDGSGTMYGDLSMRTIASINLQDIDNINFSRESPRQVTISIRSPNRLRKNTHWFLQCYDHENAERLIEDVRKAYEKK